jgi:hypothetical protein
MNLHEERTGMEGTVNSPSRIVNNVLKFIIFTILFSLLVGCGPSFLKKQDYRTSIDEMSYGNTEAALAAFPKGEEGTFITGMEKGYLNLLAGRTEMETLKKYSPIIDNRLRYKVSHEAKSLFYAETPEEYYASEHEIVWLHLLLSWGYSLDGKPEAACVEARKSAHLLSYTWSEEGHFDDPMLRTFLAGLWTMCGSWEDARVDLRAAAMLDDSLEWTRELSERNSPPRYLFLVLGGIGPEVTWEPEFNELNPLRGVRQVGFRFRGLKSALSITDSTGKHIISHLTPDSSQWYERHLIRDNEIHDLIMDSRYGNQFAAGTGIGTTRILAGTAAGIVISVVSLGIGGGLVYLGAEIGSDDLIGYGISIGILGVGYGYKVAKRTYRDSIHDMKRDLDPSGLYRFVRFLPEYLWIGWSDNELSFPLHISTAHSDLYVSSPTLVNDSSIFVIHIPDVSTR